MISQTSEYALRAVVHLAQIGHGPAVASDIATATRVPLGYLHKILRMLAKDGILLAQRGSGGGFALAKLPSAISVLDVLRATDTVVGRIERCPLGIPGHTSLCSLHHMLDEAIAETAARFAATSIADLIVPRADIAPLCDRHEAGRLADLTSSAKPASNGASNGRHSPSTGQDLV